MTKSKNGCLKILACAGAGSDPSAGSDADADEYTDENKAISDKSRWSFRRRSTRHRVLKNSDISAPETLSSSKAKTEIAPSNNVYSSAYSYASEKPLHQEKPDEKIVHQGEPDEKPQHEEKLDGKPTEKFLEKPTEKPAEQIVETPPEQADENVTEMPTEELAGSITEKPVEEAAGREPVEEPVEKAVEKLDEKLDDSISVSSAELKQEEIASPADGSNADPDEDHVESAAVVIQSGIRTYIARQELANHKDLVKLQAVIRGHLVRRQAAESLQCLLAIVKMQGLVRAHQAQSAGMFQGAMVHSSSAKLLNNGFALKLMDSMPASRPVHIKCEPSETHVAWKWMERWSSLIPSVTEGHFPEDGGDSGLVVEKVNEDVQHEEKIVPSGSDITFPKLVPDNVEDALSPSDSSAFEAPPCDPQKASALEVEDDPEPELIENINEDVEQTDPKIGNDVEQPLDLSVQESSHTYTSRESNPLSEKSEPPTEDIMDAYKTEQTLEVEGKGSLARKSCNPAFAAAQLKFEELSLNSTVSRSNSSSYLDAPSKSKVDMQDSASPKQNSETSRPESTVGHDAKIVPAASECGTEISISSTLDSPDRSEADGGEIVLEMGGLEERNYVSDNADTDTRVVHSETKNTCGVIQPVEEEEQNGDVSNPVVATDSVLVEEADTGLEMRGLSYQPEESVESYVKSPEGTPMSRTTFAESHGTPSSEVSVNTRKNKSRKPRSHVSRRSLTSPSSDSVGRSSTDNLSKDYRHAKRESSGKIAKSDHGDQEPRVSNSTPLPSYMQFTESARAKASASVSPKLSPDVQDNNPRKRHSLPMTNGKHETSPRMQRSSSQAQQSVKSNGTVPRNPADKRWNI